ncbi:MAG: helix-turn-helix domain-containing protein [Bacteroidetes bacterium]|nr:helix-turn-helix domain-containing protein [Bacteroidota bacterium]
MSNPFETIDARLSNIENLLLDIKHNPVKSEQPQQHTEQLLTIQQAAKFLSLTVPTMYGKVSKNELPFMKRGKRLYFSRDEIMQYLKDGRKKTLAEINAEAQTYLSNKKKS